MPFSTPALRPLTQKPPANFKHIGLFGALNSAMNVVSADLDVKNPEAVKKAKRKQLNNDYDAGIQNGQIILLGKEEGKEEMSTGPFFLKQVDENFDIAQYWRQPTESTDYYTPLATILNREQSIPNSQTNTVYSAKTFNLALADLESKIRAKKLEHDAFDDLFFAELYLAGMSLAALIMNNQSVWTVQGKIIAHPMPKEMDLLTRTIALTNAILDNPRHGDLANQALALHRDIAQHIDDYKKDPLVGQSKKLAFWINALEVTAVTCVILSCITFVSALVCFAITASPVAIIILMGLELSVIIGGVCGYYLDDRYWKTLDSIDSMGDCMLRTRERQAVISRFFDTTNELIDKDLPTTVATPAVVP